MHHLIYLSSASPALSDEDLHDILTKSRKNNAQSAVTGLLLYHDGSILQILEGEKTAVYAIYLKIMKDPRHTSLVTLIDEETASRDFSDWSMGFKRLSNREWEQLSGYINLGNRIGLLQELESKSIQVLTMIKTFLAVNAR
ncbi:MAG: BLUF domain-containing protein [Williamsia sp.]|nr:BLUF domain-containing protein [Williamsia sp.]